MPLQGQCSPWRIYWNYKTIQSSALKSVPPLMDPLARRHNRCLRASWLCSSEGLPLVRPRIPMLRSAQVPRVGQSCRPIDFLAFPKAISSGDCYGLIRCCGQDIPKFTLFASPHDPGQANDPTFVEFALPVPFNIEVAILHWRHSMENISTREYSWPGCPAASTQTVRGRSSWASYACRTAVMA